MILLAEYEDLPSEILLTKNRRPVYYTKQCKIPKKYSGFSFDNKGRLIDSEGNPIIKNKRVVNKPRKVRINFNLFWSGVIHRSVRSKIKSYLTDFFSRKKIKKIKEFPVVIHFEYYTQNLSDIDNESFIYIKSFFDTLTKMKVIPNDTKNYIKGYSWVSYKSDKNKLVISYAK